MAITIPTTIDHLDFSTAGERRVFSKLQALPDNYHVYYEIRIGERDWCPDFTILHPQYGVWVVEVKDWSQSHIRNPNDRSFEVRMNRHWQELPNPERKAQNYIAQVKEACRLYDLLLDNYDQLVVPIGYLVAFPNMPYAEFEALGLSRYLNPWQVALKDEIHHTDQFLDILHQLTEPRPTPLSAAQFEVLRGVLDPSIKKTIRARQMSLLQDDQPAQQFAEFQLDIEQTRIAKHLGEGPRLLRGMAGSGKTLVLLLRARLEAHIHATLNARRQNKRTFRMLILCYNITLATYMREAFETIEIPIEGNAEITIAHFHKWAFDYIETKRGKGAFNRTPLRDLNAKINHHLEQIEVKPHEQYDAIYIDEGQDFELNWITFLFHQLLKGDDPKQKRFLIALDNAQRIYKHQGVSNFSWAQLDIPMQGRSRVLRRIYRNSPRVWMFAGFLLGDIHQYYQEDDHDQASEVRFAPRRGIDPVVIHCPTFDQQIQQAVQCIEQLLDGGYSFQQILVVYHTKKIRGFPLVERFIDALQEAGVDFVWVSENQTSKKRFRWQEDTIKISTVHSAKGLDADAVIVLGADGFDEYSDNQQDDAIALLYVAMTRAREHLTLLYTQNTPIAQRLQRTYRDYNKLRPKIVQFEEQALL